MVSRSTRTKSWTFSRKQVYIYIVLDELIVRYHHLVSLACMFGPSPDWCVGVSSINLCLPDCSWIEERAFDLRPFDAGTDNGPTYMVFNKLLKLIKLI